MWKSQTRVQQEPEHHKPLLAAKPGPTPSAPTPLSSISFPHAPGICEEGGKVGCGGTSASLPVLQVQLRDIKQLKPIKGTTAWQVPSYKLSPNCITVKYFIKCISASQKRMYRYTWKFGSIWSVKRAEMIQHILLPKQPVLSTATGLWFPPSDSFGLIQLKNPSFLLLG